MTAPDTAADTAAETAAAAADATAADTAAETAAAADATADATAAAAADTAADTASETAVDGGVEPDTATDNSAETDSETMSETVSQPAPVLTLEQLPAEVREAVEAIEEHKGINIAVLDIGGVASYTDYLVVCSGRSDPQVAAISKGIQKRLGKKGNNPKHVEGGAHAVWILLDYIDFVVHVFLPETRAFYELERLWRDVPMLQIDTE